MSARQTALEVLIGCRKQQGWSNGLLKKQIVRDNLDKRDAALATRLAYGVIQNRGLLDFYCKQLLTGRLKDMHPVVRDILHLGLYQIRMMDKIPASAAVNESVELAKKYCPKQPQAAKLVNGVLRNAAAREDWQEPEDLAVKYSHPAGLLALLRSYVGQEKLEGMLQANNAAPDTVIQVNTLKITRAGLLDRLAAEGVEAKPHRWMEQALVISGTGSLENLPSFRQGLYYVQDAAARLAVDCAGIQPGENVLITDCCAAPGGKSFAAALALEGQGRIVSSDVHEHKVGLMEKGAQRLGFQNVYPRRFDATAFDPMLEGKVDYALVDVPCSGYGIIRKKPDIREKDPDSMQELPKLQLEILKNQARYVRPGGVLLYSTCTLVRRENEGVVEKFLKANDDFCLEKLPLPGAFPENETGMLTLIPGEYDTDGFFIARLRRKP